MPKARVPSNIKVRPLNVTSLLGAGKVAIQKFEKKRTVVKAAIHGRLALFVTATGLYVLSEEGVLNCEPITDAKKYKIDFYGDYDDGSFDLLPAVQAEVAPAALIACATLPDERLEDFIRRFGARLEENYELVRDHIISLHHG